MREKIVDGRPRLVMTQEHEKLIRLAGQMKKGKGLTMISALIQVPQDLCVAVLVSWSRQIAVCLKGLLAVWLQGDPTSVDRNMVDAAQAQLEDFLRAERIEGFPRWAREGYRQRKTRITIVRISPSLLFVLLPLSTAVISLLHVMFVQSGRGPQYDLWLRHHHPDVR